VVDVGAGFADRDGMYDIPALLCGPPVQLAADIPLAFRAHREGSGCCADAKYLRGGHAEGVLGTKFLCRSSGRLTRRVVGEVVPAGIPYDPVAAVRHAVRGRLGLGGHGWLGLGG